MILAIWFLIFQCKSILITRKNLTVKRNFVILSFNGEPIEFCECSTRGQLNTQDFNYNRQRQDSISTRRDATWIAPITSYSIIRHAPKIRHTQMNVIERNIPLS